jgi:hypothetical protein
MHSQNEQILGTIELLVQNDNSHPFLWDTATQGEFDLWRLLISEGFVSRTDPEISFAHWQNIEQWGTPTDQTHYEYAPPRSERKDDPWNDEIAAERNTIYKNLQLLLNDNLSNLQAYTLAIPGSRHFEWDHPNFFVSIVIGETSDREWLPCTYCTRPNRYSSSKRLLYKKHPRNLFPNHHPLDNSTQPNSEPTETHFTLWILLWGL